MVWQDKLITLPSFTPPKFTDFRDPVCTKWLTVYWWLIESYLIDGIGVALQLFWEFFHMRWKILFSHGGKHVRWDWTHARWDWNEHLKTRKTPKILFGWRGHLVIIFNQFTFFRYSTAWTISKQSSSTITDKICKHSLSFITQYHQIISKHSSGKNTKQTIRQHSLGATHTGQSANTLQVLEHKNLLILLENSQKLKVLFWVEETYMLTIIDQFTFFRYSAVWTISKQSSGTIIDKICKHSFKFHCTILSKNQWRPFKCNTNQTIS